MIMEEEGRLILVPSIHSLSRLYIEPTSTCNLNCVTCIRNNWHEGSSNEKDCLKNEFPACGGCLWAQGVIQCP
ncbi:MAG TPA: hypothetical protein DDX29_11650 [Clostridiales bacterium]|nr:hypothetical protein [Clostridiales bacterium]